jgi:hypothetical protein
MVGQKCSENVKKRERKKVFSSKVPVLYDSFFCVLVVDLKNGYGSASRIADY